MGYDMQKTKSGFDPITSDRYTFHVDDASAEAYSKNNVDGHHIELTLHIADGTFINRKVWDHIYLPGALWRARQVLQAAGKATEAASKNIEASDIAIALVGTEFTAWLEASKGTNDAPRYDLKEYKPVAGTVVDEVPDIDFQRALDRV